jgi:hypothetical protein
MKTRNLVIGFIFLIGIVAAILIIKGKAKINSLPVPAVPVATPSIQQKLQSKFQNLVIPNSGDQVDLIDVSGGFSMGIATRNEIIADLPTLPKGQFYQGILENSSGKTVLLGNLRMEKGGWILDYDSSKFPGYNKIIVTQGVNHILEGSFQLD